MRFPPSLQEDLGNFLDSLFTSPNYRKEAARLFDVTVSHRCKTLLAESRPYTSMTDGLLASDPWAHANPKQALKLVELFIRALAATKDESVRGKQIDIKAMLAKRLKHRKKTCKENHLTDLTYSSFRRLYQSAHKRLKESFADETAEVIQRETSRLLDLEATKLLAQVTLIVNGNAAPTDKLGELCSLLLSYDDDDEEDAEITAVDTNPHAKG